MKKKLTTVEFRGTKEQEEQLLAIIEKYRGVQGAMMPILQQTQDVYGYLPVEAMRIIAEKTGKSIEEIFGIASFYSQFSLNPKGEVAIAVCLGTACYVKGSGDIYDKLKEVLGVESGQCTADRKFSLDATRCVGCCGLAPVMTINDDVYGKITPDDVAGILEKYN